MNLAAANEFQDWILGLDLLEVQYSGLKFTWTNFQNGDRRIYRKLDWCFANQIWYSKLGEPSCTVINFNVSDHCGLLVDIFKSGRRTRSPFKFFNMWCDHPDFFNIVENVWRTPVKGGYMFRVFQKLKLLRVELRHLNRKSFGMISSRVLQCQEVLDEVQNKLQADPFNLELQKLEKIQLIQLQQLLAWEEAFLRHKSRCQWINLGDPNSKFFFRAVQQRKARNYISHLTLNNGEVVSDQVSISEAVLTHYKDFFGTVKPRRGILDGSVFQEMVVSVDDWDMLCSVASDQEVKEALWSIKNDKSPGPDGYNSYFFKKTWNIVGKDICLAVKDYFRYGSMLRQANSTSITLIPKGANPQSLNEYRPISCCNVIYKVISKILSGRLRRILDSLVHLNQSAFIPGRQIVDNILLAHELLRGYHRDKDCCCALKVDIQKTYDSVSWDFLEEVLLAFRFPSHFIKLVMNAVRSSMFSIMVNGQLEGFFPGKQGLRQGDPISPLLFVLCMEYFTRVLNKNTGNGFIFHKNCAELKLSHLCFADDLFVFSNGDTASIGIIKAVIQHFQEVSGLKPNLQKSLIFFSLVLNAMSGNILFLF